MATLAHIFLDDNKPTQADISEAMQESQWSKAYLICTRFDTWELLPKRPNREGLKHCEKVSIN